MNSLGDVKSRDDYRAALVGFLSDYKNDLSSDSQRRLNENPLRILDSKAEEDRKIIKNAPRLSAFLTIQAQKHFEHVTNALDRAGIKWQLDVNLVRGLDYYSHTAFEFITNALGSQGTVLGGGRYDGLSAMLGGPDIGAVGFAAGVERLALLIEQREEFTYDIAVIIADENAVLDGFALAQSLRSNNLKVDIPLAPQLGKKLKRASVIGCALSFIIGQNEITSRTVLVKFMATGEQKQIAISEAISFAQQFLECELEGKLVE